MLKKILFISFLLIPFIYIKSNTNLIVKASLSTGTEYSMVGGGFGLLVNNMYIGIDSRYRLSKESWYPWGPTNQYVWYGSSNNIELGYLFKNLLFFSEIGLVELERTYIFTNRENKKYINYGGGIGLKIKNIFYELHYTPIEKLIFKISYKWK